MKIGIDTHAAEREGAGNCTYIRNMASALSQVDKRNEYVLYGINLQHSFYRQFHDCENFMIRKLAIDNSLVRIPFLLARATFKDALDILHVQYIAPPFHRGKLVTTIHDLGFLHCPDFFSKFEVWRSRMLIRLTAKRSDAIITGSHFSKQDIVDSYGIHPAKIQVVSYGVSPCFSPALDPLETRKILRKYGIQKPYLLSVGRLNPRKNIVSIVKIFSLMKRENHLPHRLIIVGKKDFETRKILLSVDKIEHNEDILFTWLVPDQDLPFLYREADVFLYPSLYEGVGLPVLEAMRSGVPVVTSDSSGLKEIVGDAGILVNPLDLSEISRAVLRIISDRDFRNTCRTRGISRTEKLTWLSTAQQTLKVYQRVHLS
jgi:glycosyltransferase involved in cell wall biosynthesis